MFVVFPTPPPPPSLSLSLTSRSDLGKSLNTDEAAALGAVYQAAGQTKLFRVKKFIVKDANVFPIMVRKNWNGVIRVYISTVCVYM